jgi:protein transport protein SEC61 subunit gamma-like protein
MGLRNVIDRIRRVLLISSKPDKEEFRLSTKITGLGFILIGIIGFVIFMIVQLIGGI